MDDLLRVIEEISNAQATMFYSVASFLRNLEEQLDTNNVGLYKQSITVKSYHNVLTHIILENKFLKIKTATLEYRLEEYNKSARKNSFEIHGVPETTMESQERLIEILKDIGNVLEFNITDSMIDCCYRIKHETDEKIPAIIVVRFVRLIDKEELLARRQVREKLSTSDIGFSVDQEIDLLDAVTPKWRKIFNVRCCLVVTSDKKLTQYRTNQRSATHHYS
ncbi:hypothetical protein J6590_055775 [Homalodisca vitripennis]|nr:hypothetical protein J6590_055775 [Homalodisca vitripennis]